MSLPYIDQDTRDEIQRADNAGTHRDIIAGKLGITLDELCQLMGWPQWKEVPAATGEDFDLFAVERLDGVL